MQDRLPVTPAAWTKWLANVQPDLSHEHKLVLVSDPSEPDPSSSDKENQPAPANPNTTHLLCVDCHSRFAVSISWPFLENTRNCSGAGYLSHHFHRQFDGSEQCCGCNLVLSWEFQPPLIPLSLFEEMSDTRKINVTYAAYMNKESEPSPTVATALATILAYIRDMLKGVRRSINAQGKTFVGKIGADSSSIRLFSHLGFTLAEDNMLMSGLGTSAADETLLRTIRQEIIATLDKIRSPHGLLNIPDQSLVPKLEPASPAFSKLLGAEYRQRLGWKDLAYIEEYHILGIVPDMVDNVIVWAYRLLVNEQPHQHSQWLEALQRITQNTNSKELETEVAIEHSQGVYAPAEIDNAYQYFGIADSNNVEDDLILGLYDIKVTDEPTNMKEHANKLAVIANHRLSTSLINVLSTIEGYSTPIKKKGNREKAGAAMPSIPAPPSAEAAFSETKRVWQKATNLLKTEVLHAKDILMEYSSPAPAFPYSAQPMYLSPQLGMISIPTTTAINPVNIDTNPTTDQSTSSKPSSPTLDKRSERSNSTASIASLAVAKYSSAVHALSNAVAPAANAASSALATLTNTPQFNNSPVGLNNIGNTCYLNSLLQYYFTLKCLRDTVLEMDQHVEHEDGPEWQDKRIGGIKVGRTEVRQAKQFVGLLRDLFLNLMNTTDPSIAPQVSLAYMALTSADEIANSSVNLPNLTNASPAVDTSAAADVNPATEQKSDLPMVVEEQLEPTANEPKDMHAEAEAEPEPENDNMNLENNEQTPKVAEEENLSTSQLRSIPSTETLATTGSQTTVNETIDIPPVPERRPVPPPPPYANIDGKGKSTTSTNPFETTVRPQDPTKMLFGRQQDVTECMGNCMYFFEAALRPYAPEGSEKTTDLVKELFYGKARQILSYNNEQTDQLVTKVKEEEFSHLIIDAADGKNLYDGLDEYFFADKVDDFQGGNCAVREVAVHHFPPILHIQVQRVQFDRTSARVYKSNAFVQFDEVIYLDRYLDSNFEALAERRKRVTECRKQVEAYSTDIRELKENKKYPLPVADMLEITAKILEDNQENSAVSRDDYEKVMNILNEEIAAVRGRIDDRQSKIDNLAQEIKTQYDDLRDCQYQLHAVFIHQGQANYGHYWIYIRDHVDNKWWKYNDTNVTEVSSEEIFKDTTGSTANPYFLVYVRSSDISKYVMTVCRKKPTSSQ